MTLAAAQDADTTNGTRAFTVAATGLTSRTVTATEADDDGGTARRHVDNPYAGAKGYVNPDWSAKAAAEPGGSRDRQPAHRRLAGPDRRDRRHRRRAWACAPTWTRRVTQDAANGAAPLTSSSSSTTCPAGTAPRSPPTASSARRTIDRYKTEYIDPIAAILADPKYASLRIVTIIEIDSLPNLVTNTGGRAGATAECDTMKANGNYVKGVGYALDKLRAIPQRLQLHRRRATTAGSAGTPTSAPPPTLFTPGRARHRRRGVDNVDGFITNTANYSRADRAVLHHQRPR